MSRTVFYETVTERLSYQKLCVDAKHMLTDDYKKNWKAGVQAFLTQYVGQACLLEKSADQKFVTEDNFLAKTRVKFLLHPSSFNKYTVLSMTFGFNSCVNWILNEWMEPQSQCKICQAEIWDNPNSCAQEIDCFGFSCNSNIFNWPCVSYRFKASFYWQLIQLFQIYWLDDELWTLQGYYFYHKFHAMHGKFSQQTSILMINSNNFHMFSIK